jgi:hypothetical protein
MNMFETSLKDARQFVKNYLNLFKYGRGSCGAGINPISLGALS